MCQLIYKAEWYGHVIVQIDKWYPNFKRCNCCGHIVDSLALYVRLWSCPECLVNASLNIKAIGQTVLAGGA